MKNSTKSQIPIEPLDDTNLDQVSGGSNSYLEAINMYDLISAHVIAIIKPFASDINDWANEIKYENVLACLETYDKSKHTELEKSTAFAAGWNKHHPGQTMRIDMASLILGIENKYDRAAIACFNNTNDILKALQQIYK